ncbi:MAG: hypothetical protein K0R58_7 [Ramlibacter sp.]|nr:hypothetical protein [Ramlibacter sp.]
MKPEDQSEEPDIVQVVLQHVLAVAPGFNGELAARIDQEVRSKYGGLRVRILKRGKYLTPEQRLRAYQDALTNMPTRELLSKHRISLATLKRLVKKGPGE